MVPRRQCLLCYRKAEKLCIGISQSKISYVNTLSKWLSRDQVLSNLRMEAEREHNIIWQRAWAVWDECNRGHTQRK